MKILALTLGLALALLAGSAPAFAGDPSIPVWSGAPVMAPGDDMLAGHNPTQTTGKHGHNHIRNG